MSIKLQSLPYSQTRFFSDLVVDYLAEKESLCPFYHYAPDLASFEKAIQDKSRQNTDRAALAEILKDQYKQAGINPAHSAEVWQNIEKLKNKNTFTIATAHQPVLFTGPVFFVYKIFSAINLSEQLKNKYPEYDFVPVFWMGSEDHDIEEINHIHIFNKKITWADAGRGPSGRLNTTTLKAVLDEAKKILGDTEPANEIFKILQKAYGQNSTLANATRIFVNELFRQYGLVVISGDDGRLKKQFIPVMKEELLQQKTKELVNPVIRQLEEKYQAQANPREINLFYMKEALRERIIKPEPSGKWEVLNTDISFSKDELIEEVENHPERFSPNVMLRPLYQETILPNLAYIGGGSEIAYWLEQKSVFDHFKINYPILLLRNSAMWVEGRILKKLRNLNIEIPEIFEDTEALIKKHVKEKSEHRLNLEKEKNAVQEIFRQAMEKAAAIDSTLKNPVLAEQQKSINALSNIEAKMSRAEKRRHETGIQQIINIKDKLFPDGKLQERHENFMSFYLLYGEEFFAVLKEHFNPLRKEFLIFWEEQ